MGAALLITVCCFVKPDKQSWWYWCSQTSPNLPIRESLFQLIKALRKILFKLSTQRKLFLCVKNMNSDDKFIVYCYQKCLYSSLLRHYSDAEVSGEDWSQHAIFDNSCEKFLQTCSNHKTIAIPQVQQRLLSFQPNDLNTPPAAAMSYLLVAFPQLADLIRHALRMKNLFPFCTTMIVLCFLCSLSARVLWAVRKDFPYLFLHSFFFLQSSV